MTSLKSNKRKTERIVCDEYCKKFEDGMGVHYIKEMAYGSIQNPYGCL